MNFDKRTYTLTLWPVCIFCLPTCKQVSVARVLVIQCRWRSDVFRALQTWPDTQDLRWLTFVLRVIAAATTRLLGLGRRSLFSIFLTNNLIWHCRTWRFHMHILGTKYQVHHITLLLLIILDCISRITRSISSRQGDPCCIDRHPFFFTSDSCLSGETSFWRAR